MIKQPDKNLVSNQYTLFDLSRFIHSDCGSSPVKMYTSEHCLKKNSCAQLARNSNPWITVQNVFPTELRWEIPGMWIVI